MKKIELTQGKYAMVDDEDFEKVNQHQWSAQKYRSGWRAMRNIRDSDNKWTIQYMHRMIMDCPEDLQIDHSDHNGLNNQKHKLRICTNAENQYNQKSKKGVSKYKGVVWHKRNRRWMAQIVLNYKTIFLGYRDVESECAKLYDKAARELFGEFAYLNFKT